MPPVDPNDPTLNECARMLGHEPTVEVLTKLNRVAAFVDIEVGRRTNHAREHLAGIKNLLVTAVMSKCDIDRCEQAQLQDSVRAIVAEQEAAYRSQANRRAAATRFFTGAAFCVGATCLAAWIHPMFGLAVSSLSGLTAVTFLRAYGIRFLFPKEAEAATVQFDDLRPILQQYVGPHWQLFWEKWKAVPTHKHEAMVLFLLLLPSFQHPLFRARDALRESPPDTEYAVNLVGSTVAAMLLPMMPYLFENDVQLALQDILGPLAHDYFTDWVDFGVAGSDCESGNRRFIDAVLENIFTKRNTPAELQDVIAPLVRGLLTPATDALARHQRRPLRLPAPSSNGEARPLHPWSEASQP